MVLTLDVGNTQIFGGVFEHQELTIRFRKASRPPHLVRRAGPVPAQRAPRERHRPVARAADCAVLRHARDALFAAQLLPQVLPRRSFHPAARGKNRPQDQVSQSARGRRRSHCERHRRRPSLSGPERRSSSTSVRRRRSTWCTATRDYLGGIILPGLRIAMEALEKNTARLPNGRNRAAAELIGRSTVESIQSGLYFGNRAMVRELTREIRLQTFAGAPR